MQCGEELLTLMHTRLGANDEEDAPLKKILESIAKDEEKHGEMLKPAIEIASTKKKT